MMPVRILFLPMKIHGRSYLRRAKISSRSKNLVARNLRYLVKCLASQQLLDFFIMHLRSFHQTQIKSEKMRMISCMGVAMHMRVRNQKVEVQEEKILLKIFLAPFVLKKNKKLISWTLA